jgi:hypothetical protein
MIEMMAIWLVSRGLTIISSHSMGVQKTLISIREGTRWNQKGGGRAAGGYGDRGLSKDRDINLIAGFGGKNGFLLLRDQGHFISNYVCPGG